MHQPSVFAVLTQPPLVVYCRRLETCTMSSSWASGERRRWRCLMMTWRTLLTARTRRTQVFICMHVFTVQHLCRRDRPHTDHDLQRMNTERVKKNWGRQLCLTEVTVIIPQASTWGEKHIQSASRCWHQTAFTDLMVNTTNKWHPPSPAFVCVC